MHHFYFNTIEDVRKLGSHLSLEDRDMILALHRKGYSLSAIATEICCAHSTVCYELRREILERKVIRGHTP